MEKISLDGSRRYPIIASFASCLHRSPLSRPVPPPFFLTRKPPVSTTRLSSPSTSRLAATSSHLSFATCSPGSTPPSAPTLSHIQLLRSKRHLTKGPWTIYSRSLGSNLSELGPLPRYVCHFPPSRWHLYPPP